MNRISYLFSPPCIQHVVLGVTLSTRGPASCRLALWMHILHVEYAGGNINYGILFRFSLFYEYSILEYEHVHVIYRVSQAEYVIRIRVVAPQEYVNIYSTRRLRMTATTAA